MIDRTTLGDSKKWVVKIGSALLTNHGEGLDHNAIGSWVKQLVRLRKAGLQFVIVSSGAVAEGMQRLNWKERPRSLHEQQAAAAVGQMGLIEAYARQFSSFGIQTAQILLSHTDIADRQRYLNARSTLRCLLDIGVVPIVNENDTVAMEELRLGDNDTLAGMVANLVEAKLLVILTDQEGLFESDPRVSPDARRVGMAAANDLTLDSMAGTAGKLGRGGMATKITAARYAARSGTSSWIANGSRRDVLLEIARGEDIGTVLFSEHGPMAARKQWLAGPTNLHGRLTVDDGAVRALQKKGVSLLAVGVVGVRGRFQRGDIIACCDTKGREVARGLVNYSVTEIEKILGLTSDRIEQVLGYIDEPEVMHRDNMVVL